jgi:hypothetical protein
LGRAVRFLAAAGIRQFIDIGSGMFIPEWRPDSPANMPGDPHRYGNLVGVAQKPE